MSRLMQGILSRGQVYSAVFERNTITKNATTLQISESWGTILTVNCKFWDATYAVNFVTEQFKAQVAGGLLINPADETTAIETHDRVTVDGDLYTVLYKDNIGRQDKVIFIALSK